MICHKHALFGSLCLSDLYLVRLPLEFYAIHCISCVLHPSKAQNNQWKHSVQGFILDFHLGEGGETFLEK